MAPELQNLKESNEFLNLLLDNIELTRKQKSLYLKDNISIMQGVTLGGTGNESGDRHPKIHSGVLIGSSAQILGNVTIGEGAKVGAGSVVLKPVAAHTTVSGVPAKVIGKPKSEQPALDTNHQLNCDMD